MLIYNVLTSERSGSSTLKELMNEEKSGWMDGWMEVSESESADD